MPERIVIPHSARSMGQRITGTRGSGKSRLLGRLIAWADVQANIPTVIIDPVGALSDNLLDVVARLPQAEQERLKLHKRIVYVDMAGTGPEGHVCPFPLLYRLGKESLYDQAMRFVSVTIKTDPDLRRASIQGANALEKIGVHAGMLLAALGCQLTEAESLLNEPTAWEGRIRQALAEHPEELGAAASYFLTIYPKLPERERQFQTSAYRQKLGLFVDPVLRAIYGADTPGIDWSAVIKKRQCVLLDFRHVPEHRKQFCVVWAHHTLLEWIRRRGPGRHTPLSLIVDEATYLLSDAQAREDPLADDLEELISRLARNHAIWCTYAHQELNQLNERASRLFMDLGTQFYGRTADIEAAMTIARRFYRWTGKEVKKVDAVWHPPTMFANEWTEYRTAEFTRDEQAYRDGLKLFDLPTFHFLLGVAPREGELPTSLKEISIADHDKGRYVQEDLVREARAHLMTRHPNVPDILASIARRSGANQGHQPVSVDEDGVLVTPPPAQQDQAEAPRLKRRARATHPPR
jgi:hypothetical protein